MALIPWAEWRPDVSDYNGSHSRTITNVFPRGDGYGPIAGLSAYSDALPEACRGLFAGLLTDGTIAVFAGTSTALYRLDNSDLSWDLVSKTDATELDYTGSTNIGNATGGGNLAAAFDGGTAETAANSASLAAVNSASVGKTLATNAAVRTCKIYGSNDAGYVSAINPTVVANMYGKTGAAPTLFNGTEGTLIGTLSFTDTADESVARTITSTDPHSLWTHIWVDITHNGAANAVNIAELEFFSADAYTLPAGNQWQFAQMANEVIAVNGSDTPQALTLGSDTVFSDLAGSPPTATYVTIINEHVILSGLTGAPFRIAWSARSDPAAWTAGTDGSDIQDFPEGGIVRGVAGGEYDGLVFQENVIRRLVYVGGTLVFEISRIVNDRGLVAPYSLVRAAGRTFFLSAAGFEEIISGGVPNPIGKERFDRTFQAEWDSSAKQLMIGVADPRSTRIFWFYKSLLGTTGLFDKGIVWDYAIGRGARIEGITGEFVAPIAQPGVTLEGLDSISSSIDALSVSLDDISISSGTYLAFANSSHVLSFMSANVLEAVIETADIVNEKRVFVRGARPITDADGVLGSVYYRQKSSDTPAATGEMAMNDVGFTPHRIDTRHARFRNRIPASENWSFSIGVEPDMVPTGRR
jgi:hypothetical protein